jgi:HSP20 family protein
MPSPTLAGSQYTIKVDVPGVSRENLTVDVDEEENAVILACKKHASYTSSSPEGAGSSSGSSTIKSATQQAGGNASQSMSEQQQQQYQVQQQQQQQAGVTWHVCERAYGEARRSVRLPPDADLSKISAKMEHGVLTLSVPKRPEGTVGGRKRVEIA